MNLSKTGEVLGSLRFEFREAWLWLFQRAKPYIEASVFTFLGLDDHFVDFGCVPPKSPLESSILKVLEGLNAELHFKPFMGSIEFNVRVLKGSGTVASPMIQSWLVEHPLNNGNEDKMEQLLSSIIEMLAEKASGFNLPMWMIPYHGTIFLKEERVTLILPSGERFSSS